MNKWYASLLISIMILVVNFCYAQPKTSTYISNGKTVTDTGPIPGDNLSEIYTREAKDKDGNVTDRTTWTKDIKGEWTFKHEKVTPGGTPIEVIEGKFINIDGKYYFTEYKWTKYDKSGLVEIETLERGADGRLHRKVRTRDREPEDIITDGIMVLPYGQPPFQNNSASTTKVPKEHALVPGNNSNCDQRVALLFGPSYLSRDFGDEKESSFGVHLIANYNFNKHIAAGIDLSTYSTKIGDEKLTTSFYLLDGVYTFGKGSQECPPHVSVFGRILIGMMHEKFAGGSGSGPAYGAGVGSDYRFSNNFSIGVGFDYLRGKFEDESVSNVRGSVLITFRFGSNNPV